jgi:glycosyltransferase involved in cell wall biosynthesis
MSQKFRFHILPPPHVVTNPEYSACAYGQKTRKFGKMMVPRGHEVIHYGHEDSDLVCTEHVTVVTNDDFKKAYGDFDWRKSFFKFDMKDHAYQTFYKNAIEEIGKRKQKNDFILPFWGYGHKPVCDAHAEDMIVVEPGIGYAHGQFSPWRIYESYAIRSAVGGADAVGTCKESWYHAVIPNYFDPEEFSYSKDREDYFLFMGRIYPGKGIDVAYQVCQKLGLKLKIAGQGNLEEFGYKELPGQIEQIGYMNSEDRKKILSKAKGFWLPSMFNEPFGGASIEAMFAGCPIITTDWGSHAENNLHGVTGYRCRTFSEFLWAAKNIDKINPQDCRDWAMSNFTLDRVARMYEHYFTMVYNVYNGKGWYHEDPHSDELEWLNRYYPSGIKIGNNK